MKKWYLLSILVWLAACAPVQGSPKSVAAPSTPTALPTPAGSGTTPTRTPLTTEQWMYPYTIDGLRHHKFENGPVTIVKALTKTSVYSSFLISYPSDGLRITGVMQIPVEGHAPYPVILMDHGYFNRIEYKSGDGSDRAAEYLNKHGYLTLSSDYRSWGGSDIGASLYYSGLAIDVVNLFHAIPSIPQADATRVGIWGHSMGGAVTMKVLTLGTGIKAGVLYSTVSADDTDPLARWGLGCIGDIAAGEQQADCNSSDVVPLSLPPELIKAYYEASKDATILRETSPIYHLDLITAPIEINYGTDDGKTSAGTPPEWSKKLFIALEVAGKNAQIFGYEGEFHSFNGDSWVAFMERSAHFFDQYVKGER